MPITTELTPAPELPDRIEQDQTVFDMRMAAYWAYIKNDFEPELNNITDEINTTASGITSDKDDAEVARTGAETAQGKAETAMDYAREWASKDAESGTVDDSVNTPDYSAKAYAVDDMTGEKGGSAKDWAQTAEDVEIIPGEYSAKHWARKTAKGERLTATSATAVTIGIGSKTFILAESYRAFISGTSVKISETADPVSNYMTGIVTSYDDTTDELVVNVTASGGSGTISAWSIGLYAGGDADTVGGYSASQLLAAGVSGWERKTAGFTAESGKGYKVDAGLTVTLPASPLNDAIIYLSPLGDMAASNGIINRNGNKIMGLEEDLTWDINSPINLIYDETNTDWRLA